MGRAAIDVVAAADERLQLRRQRDVILQVQSVRDVRRVHDARDREAVVGRLRLDRVVEVDGFGAGDAAAGDGTGPVVVALCFPAEHQVLLEAAAHPRGYFGQVHEGPAFVRELQALAIDAARRLDEQEFHQEVVVVEVPVRERVAEADRVAQLTRVRHLEVVVVRGGLVFRRAEVPVARDVREDAVFGGGAEVGVEQRDAGVAGEPVARERVIDVDLVVVGNTPRERRRQVDPARVIVPVAFPGLGTEVDSIQKVLTSQTTGRAKGAAAE